MNNKLLLFGLLAFVILVSGCTQPEPVTSYKYVCSDGTIEDSPARCQTVECVDCDEYCEDYCEGIEEPDGAITVDYIKTEMNKANYCETKDDCIETNTKCPIGCYNVVNIADVNRINDLVKEFKQTCFQTCTTLMDVNCVDSKCVPMAYGTS